MKMLLLSLLLLPGLTFAMQGLKVGAPVPTLELNSTSGKTIKLHEQKNPTVLVFYRGSWCPYCIRQLISLEKEVMSAKIGDADVIAISVDKISVAKKMKAKNNFSFHVVSDPTASSLKAFNIVNKLGDDLVKKYKASYSIDVEGDSGQTHHMVAHPGVFIIKDKKVVFADVHVDYKSRTSNEEILKNLK